MRPGVIKKGYEKKNALPDVQAACVMRLALRRIIGKCRYNRWNTPSGYNSTGRNSSLISSINRLAAPELLQTLAQCGLRIPSMRAAIDWLPFARCMASTIRQAMDAEIVGNAARERNGCA